jgi:pterin-4a-carbinolamine dehydratase
VNDFDRYSVFLDSVQEHLHTESLADGLKTWSELNVSESLASALSRHNFEEAISIIQQVQKNSELSADISEEAY